MNEEHWGLATAVGIIVIFMAAIAWSSWENQQPCKYFEDRRIENVPARCFGYYGHKGVQ